MYKTTPSRLNIKAHRRHVHRNAHFRVLQDGMARRSKNIELFFDAIERIHQRYEKLLRFALRNKAAS